MVLQQLTILDQEKFWRNVVLNYKVKARIGRLQREKKK